MKTVEMIREMTAEHAAMILRRKATDAQGRDIRRVALFTLAQAGYSDRAVEIEGMTTLDDYDRMILDAARR